MSENAAAPPPSSIMPLIGAFMISRLVYLAAELGIADLIAGGLNTAEALADRTGTNAPALYRMLRALCAHGVFDEPVAGQFGLGPMGAQLQSGVPGSVRNFARFFGDQRAWRSLAEFEHTIRTGETGMKRAFGTSGFAYLASHPAERAIFDSAMADMTRHIARAAVGAYDFSPFRVITDVGGGNGTFLAEILRSVPSATGIVFDVPEALADAKQTLLGAHVADRCSIAPGDFFTSVPSGADLMVVKSVIHNWNDEQATAILSRCRAAAAKQSRLLVVERLMPPRMTVSPANQRAVSLDIRMLAVAGGIERTEDQYREMLAAAGFTATRTILLPAPSDQAMIEAAPS